jgi:hypothetical protein
MELSEYIALHEADLTFNDRTDRVRDELREILGGDWADRYLWIRDISDTWAVYEDSGETNTPGLFRVGYTIDDAGTCTIVGPAVAVEPVTTYTPAPEDPAPTILEIEPDEAERELVGDTIELLESVVRTDGTVPIKIIAPGWGTSGYYSADVIKESGPQAFPAGTQDFWDHPTVTEASDRPERSLRDLAGVLATDAYWNESGPKGPGLYGDVKVFADYQPALEELAPHIGVSIRATGKAHLGEAEGERGLIIDEIVAAKSVDFVTVAGAGGEVLDLFEAVRSPRKTKPKEADMATDAELREARQAHEKATTELEEARALGAWAAAERDRDREVLALREARDIVTAELADDKHKALPDVMKARLTESLATNPPVKDGTIDKDALVVRVSEAVKAEVEYLASITGSGRVRGVGDTVDVDEADTTETDAKLASAFADLGLSESGQKVAAAGRA